jgi:lipid-A-disaccharide synthase-like uncharacterized protein
MCIETFESQRQQAYLKILHLPLFSAYVVGQLAGYITLVFFGWLSSRL